MQRIPIVMVENQQLPAAYPAVASAQFASPASTGTTTTISAATLNNTSGAPVTVSISIVPSGGSQANANELVTNLSVPAAGSAPTIVSALIGHTLGPGEALLLKAASATAVTPRISGYQTVQ